MSIYLSKIIHYSSKLVWQVIGDPARVDWVPGVEACEFDGAVRRFTMEGAGELRERIHLIDHERRRIEYGVIESSAEIIHHHATIQVNNFTIDPTIDPAMGSDVVWEVEIQPEQLEPFVKESMRLALIELNRVLEKELHDSFFS